MKVVLVLVLFGVLVSANDFHEDISYDGCSETEEKESMYALDDELLWYADFEKGKGVIAQPDFVDPVDYPGGYAGALGNQETCKFNLEVTREEHKGEELKQDPPSTFIVYPKDEVELGEKNILVCYVTGFYPAPVEIHWTKNEESVTEGVSTNIPVFNRKMIYSQISRLEFTPQQGDIYSCSVSHMSLNEPLTRMYEVKVPSPGVGPAVFCGLGLTIGLLGVAVGTFFLIKGNECS